MKVIYYVPVPKKFIGLWEYYQVDLEALSDLFDEVVVCDSLWKVFAAMRNTKLIYCWWWHSSAPVVFIGKILGFRTVVTGAIHMFDISGAPDFYTKSFLYRIASLVSLRLADANLFISSDQYRQVVSHLHVNNPIIVRSSLPRSHNYNLNNCLDHDDSRTAPGRKKYTFLSICWQTHYQFKRKGILETLDAMHLLSLEGDFSFQWIVAGKEGDATDFLLFKIAELGLSDFVTVLSDVTPQKKSHLFAQADLYIQPSWCEGFGNAALESMSYAVPALVSRYTAQPESVGSTGFIVLDITPQQIADKLRYFMSLDQTELRDLSVSAHKRALSDFSYHKRLSELKAVFSSFGISFQ